MKYFILAIFVSFSLVLLAKEKTEIKTLSFDIEKISLSTVKCENDSFYTRIEYKDILNRTEEPGQPELPIYYMNMSLPLGAYNIHVDIQDKKINTIILDYPIKPVQVPPITSLLFSSQYLTRPDKQIYSKNVTFPERIASIKNTSNVYGKCNEVNIAIYPVVFTPILNKLDIIESLTISISYSISKNVDKSTYSRHSIGLPFYEYSIITRDSLVSSFEKIIAWKRTKGVDAGIISLESICANNFCNNDTVSSIEDEAGQIRQYLQYAKQSGKCKYVLFGGNNRILPIRYGTALHDTWKYMNINDEGNVPSDLYFSELNSNWNIDGDDFYGEPYTMDYGSELFVGRLLCQNCQDIENYTEKLLKYERNPGNGDFTYLKRAFYSQCDQMQEMNLAQRLANSCNDIFPFYTILNESPSFNDDNPTSPTGSQIIDTLNATIYGYINWLGHGHPLSISAKSDSCQKANTYGIISIQTDTIPYIRRENGNGLDNLDNKDYPAIVYSISCTIAPFDYYRPVFQGYPNIAQSFTLGKNYGGPALIGNSRLGLATSSTNLQKLFNEEIKTLSLGEALCNAKKKNNANKHYMALTTNLIGCPEMHMWTNTPRLFETINKTDINNDDTNLSFIAYSDTVEIAIRDIWGSDDVDIYTFHGSYNDLLIPNTKGKLITLKALNHLPEILPNEEVSAEVHGRRYIYASEVTIGGSSDSTFTIESDADITIEKSKVLRLREGFSVKRGARFVVR